MTIDSHVHFWNYEPVKDAWITDDMRVIQRDFLPADAQAVFTDNNVGGCVAIQADQSDAETVFLLQLAEKNPFIKGVVGWIDLLDAELEFRLGIYKNLPKLKGFRHVAQGEPDGFLIKKEILKGIKELGKLGFTYD
ncbi:MAG: amidohydrolase, partial [Bacteroidota bacterium]